MKKHLCLLNEGLRVSVVFITLLSFYVPLCGQLTDSLINNLETSELDSNYKWSLNLSDVVVTAQYAPTHSRNAVHKIRSISLETIEFRGVSTLDNLLEQELNIRTSQDMILGSSMSLQGVSGQNVKIMIDGVPVLGRVGDDIDLSQISLHDIERVEIIEGPMSVSFGTNALGGVINLITKQSQLKRLNVQLESKYESISNMNLGLGAGVKLDPKTLLKVNADYFNFNGFNYIDQDKLEEQDKRTFDWNPKRNYSLGAILKRRLNEENSLSYKFRYFDEIINNFGIKRRLLYKPYSFDEFYLTSRVDNSLVYDGKIGGNHFLKSTIALNSYSRFKWRDRIDHEDGNVTELIEEQDSIYYNALLFRTIYSNVFEERKLNFQGGFDINLEETIGKKIQDTLFTKEHYSAIGDFAMFGSLNIKLYKKFLIQGGLRYAYNTKFKSPIIPSINIKHDIRENIIMRMSFSNGFRSPTIKELFYYFVDTNHFIVGNTELKPEVSKNIQFQLDWTPWKRKEKRFSIDFSMFYNIIQEKIDLYSYKLVNGLKVPDQASTLYTYFNQEKFKSIGSNLRMKYQNKSLNLSFGIAPTGRYNLNANELSDVPEFSLYTESNLQLRYKVPNLDLSFQLFVKYNDKSVYYFEDTNNDGEAFTSYREIDGYTLGDFSMTKGLFGHKVMVTGGVKNIFDVRQVGVSVENGTSHNGDGLNNIGTGINYFVRIKYQLNQ